MKRMIIQYTVKPERAAENQQYVEKVFEELRRNSPAGLRYATFTQPDKRTFMHLVSVEVEDGDNPLTQSDSFKAFQAGIKERCEVQPVVTHLSVVGSYHFFD
ncbi:MAG: hypothetical protein GC179_28005 [Anaerolineaceae bacterium]|nr:hypothetical protein [Anaerolineaceae bacterium]